jgi:hypothetical protein
MSWNDHHPLPGPDHSDPSVQPSIKKWKVGLVLVDFPDKPFTIALPEGGTVFGTPTADANDVPRADVPAFDRDLLPVLRAQLRRLGALADAVHDAQQP